MGDFEALKYLIEDNRFDELSKLFSFLEDDDLVRLSQVSVLWREVIIGTGEIRKRIELLGEPKLDEITFDCFETNYGAVDDVFEYCYTKYSKNTGVVYGWGSNDNGQLSDQFGGLQPMPREITKFGTVRDVSAGCMMSFLMKGTEIVSAGSLMLENPTESAKNLPAIESHALSGNPIGCSFAIDTSGRLWSWGNRGPLGRKISNTTGKTPGIVKALLDYKVKQVDSGMFSACCLTTDGEVFTWGMKNYNGQGNTDSELPVKLNIEKVRQICCGMGFGLAFLSLF